MHEDRDEQVTDFLSDAWLAAMADAAGSSARAGAGSTAGSGDPPSDPAPPDGDELVIQQVVDDGPDGAVAWFVVLEGPQVRFEVGRHSSPAITFTQDAATAAAIGSGRQSAQGAFMGGQLRVGGDVRILLERQDDLARLDDVFAAVRAATRFPEDPPATGPRSVSPVEDPTRA
jgi:hypothetical protein